MERNLWLEPRCSRHCHWTITFTSWPLASGPIIM